MAEHFPPLSATTLAAANLTGGWLAQNDLATLTAPPAVDVVVLAGNAVIPTIDAACRLPTGGGAGGSAADQRRRRALYRFSV